MTEQKQSSQESKNKDVDMGTDEPFKNVPAIAGNMSSVEEGFDLTTFAKSVVETTTGGCDADNLSKWLMVQSAFFNSTHQQIHTHGVQSVNTQVFQEFLHIKYWAINHWFNEVYVEQYLFYLSAIYALLICGSFFGFFFVLSQTKNLSFV